MKFKSTYNIPSDLIKRGEKKINCLSTKWYNNVITLLNLDKKKNHVQNLHSFHLYNTAKYWGTKNELRKKMVGQS